MSGEVLGLFLLGALLAGIFVGFPIAFTLMGMGIAFGYYAYFESARLERMVASFAGDDPGTFDSIRAWGEALASNRIFDLAPVLSAQAETLGWHGVRGLGSGSSGTDQADSDWVVLTPQDSVADTLLAVPGWSRLDTSDPIVWTDNYASVLSVLR